MLQFWTTWNFLWYSGFKLDYYKLNSPLKTSIIATSLIGGYLVYIYPRRMKVKFGEKIYEIPYSIMIGGDILLHQAPMIDLLLNNYEVNKMCIMYTYIPLLAWYNTANSIVKGKMNKIYGVSIDKILYLCSGVALGAGYLHHVIKKK
tara:strand:+ start:5907 stop:6347 length:441 start_codon:yes stop_codon:yes gene_type:complete